MLHNRSCAEDTVSPRQLPFSIVAVLLASLACDSGASSMAAPVVLTLSTTSLSFTATRGGPNPAGQIVALTGSTVSGLVSNVVYSAGQPNDWLNANLSTTTAPSTLTLTAITGT